jgi:aminoglycoside phosphotransferase (APT) family kinase protein
MTEAATFTAILETACAAAGLSAAGAAPIRFGENAIFRLPGRVVARISRPAQQAAARREVAVSRWLHASGITAVAALTGMPQPVEVDGRSVTFWEELPPHHHGSLVQVATALKRLHSLPVPEDVPLGHLDPFVRLAERISEAVTVTDDDRAWLRGRARELHARWTELPPGMPACVVHGDARTGNIVETEEGQVVILDLERCSAGPPEWDLVSTAVKHATYSSITGPEYQAFCGAYGTDVTAWDGFTVLRDIRELRMTSFVAQQAATQPQFRREASLRIACLRGLRGPRPWPWTPTD